jgi:thioredoxin-dependent peroxiredoxin
MNSGILKSIQTFFAGINKTNPQDMTTLQPGDKAPDFQGINELDQTISLKDFQGKKLILFFYPADNTPGCTAAACSLRDYYKELKEKGFEMLGVSPDTAKKHTSFIKKFTFPFSLIADTDQTIMKQYGVWGPKKFMGREFDGVLRTTFIIDETGNIQKIFTKVDTANHAQQIITSLEG